MRTIEKPWGREYILRELADYTLKELLVLPGESLSYQYHERKVETMVLVQGSANLHIDGMSRADGPMRPHHPYKIHPGDKHQLWNDGDDVALIVEVSTTHPDDVVRLQDRYGRTED